MRTVDIVAAIHGNLLFHLLKCQELDAFVVKIFVQIYKYIYKRKMSFQCQQFFNYFHNPEKNEKLKLLIIFINPTLI